VPLSPGAILARELGVPCVINCRIAAAVLRTGDLLRVDGDAGRVEVLESVGEPHLPPPTRVSS
jgi:pyruvate,water dikinase